MIALALGGRTVSEWKEHMSQAEFNRWVAFYEQSPFDDLHRYHRPAALIARSMGGGKYEDYVEMLVNDQTRQVTDADLNTFAAFGMKPPANFGKE